MSEKATTQQAETPANIIKISKDTYITTDDDHKEGMERTIPLDQLRSVVSLELALPVQKDGKEVTEIEIHPPKTSDVKSWRSTANPAGSIDLFMVKCLRRWSPTDLDVLEPYDYLRVQKVVMHFL